MSAAETGTESCAAHGGVSDEMRALAELLADRVQPWLERMAQPGDSKQARAGAAQPEDGKADGAEASGAQPSGAQASGAQASGAGPSCTACPVCAVISAVRGERPELVARLAEHASGLLAAARELLTPPGQTDQGDGTHREAPPRAAVQHVTVRQAGRGKGGAAGC
jgi:hypothetical protein